MPRITRDSPRSVYVTVSFSVNEIEQFKRTWPVSHLPNAQIWFEFDKRNGDLVDMGSTHSLKTAEGTGALLALSEDAWRYYQTRATRNPKPTLVSEIMNEVIWYGGMPLRRADVYRDALAATGSRTAADRFAFGPNTKIAVGEKPLTLQEFRRIVRNPNLPMARAMRRRYREDKRAGHSDAAEYWRGQAAAFFTGNPIRVVGNLTTRQQEAVDWARASYTPKKLHELLTRRPEGIPKPFRHLHYRPFGIPEWNEHVKILRRLYWQGKLSVPPYASNPRVCPTCKGSGYVLRYGTVHTCPSCGGRGTTYTGNPKRTLPSVLVDFGKPMYGYWDGARRGGEFVVEGIDGRWVDSDKYKKHPGSGHDIKWGCYSLNYWFTAKSGKDWKDAAGIAARTIKKRLRIPEATVEVA